MGETCAGEGSAVLRVTGKPRRAQIEGNRAGAYFGVELVITGKERARLLVNTADPYQGTLALPTGARLLLVQATGPWQIRLD